MADSEVIQFLQKLIRVPSVTPPGNEEPATRLCADHLRACGFESTWVPHGENRAHVVGRLRGAGRTPGLLYSGHVDVVPPGDVPWERDPFSAEIAEGRLYGRGASDMKSGVAALVIAAGEIARAGKPLEGDLVVAITADEESGSFGAEALVKEPLFDGLGALLVAEPSDLRVFVAEKGALWVEVTFFGKTAHGSMPDQGVNAIDCATAFLSRLGDLFPRDVASHPLLGGPTLSVGTIQGGVKVNVVPDRCVISLDVRSIPGLRHADLLARLQEVANGVAAATPGSRAEVNTIIDRDPVASPPDTPLAQATMAAVESVTGAPTEPGGVSYFSDACIFAPVLDLPMVICGPGLPEMAHQPNEYVDVRRVEQAVEVFVRATTRVLGGDGS